jgi:hypothetical protein
MTANAFHNADGLVVKQHGDYDTNRQNFVNRLKATNTYGVKKQLVMEVDLKRVGASTTFFPVDITNNGVGDGFSEEETYIPQGACIVEYYFVTSEVAAGGTDFTVGTYTKAGVAIDADGILDATDGAAANMGTVGELIIPTGDLVDSGTGQVGITADSYVAVTTNGTFTAGKGWLVLEYILAS